MAFAPGRSGNPQGRPRKLLKRVDEILSERGLEPLAEVLAMVEDLKRVRVPKAEAPKTMTPAEKRAWQLERKRRAQAVADERRLKLWLELLPYVYARPKELPEADDEFGKLPTGELAKRILAAVPDLEKMAKTA